jgi:hypothetical protein
MDQSPDCDRTVVQEWGMSAGKSGAVSTRVLEEIPQRGGWTRDSFEAECSLTTPRKCKSGKLALKILCVVE